MFRFAQHDRINAIRSNGAIVWRFNGIDSRDMKFLQSLAQQFAGKPIDWDELEESLIRADLGVPMTMRIIKTLQEREAWSLLGIGDVIKAVRAEITQILPTESAPLLRSTTKPTVILIVGVNGT